MAIFDIDHHHYFHSDPAVGVALERVELMLSNLTTKVGAFMATVQDLTQNLTDIRGLVQQLLDLVTQSDSERETLKQQLAEAIQRADMSDAARAELQAGVDSAFQASEDAENELRAKIPGVPPIGGQPLQPSYADRTAFDSAVAAYSGPEAVTLDGTEVKPGEQPALAYFTHSDQGGVIDTSGPTS